MGTAAGDISSQLRPGMYVRIPIDTNETPLSGEHRRFRVGQLVGIDPASNLATVHLIIHDFDPTPQHVDQLVSLEFLRRCRLPDSTPFISRLVAEEGIILAACVDTFSNDTYFSYFAQLGGEICIVTEDQIVVASHQQNTSPVQQLLDYEFHNPVWKGARDTLVECYAELRSATFGIEDLVGARVMLLAHQAETVARVLSDPRCRYVLADEVGLGKTIEACVILKGLLRRAPDIRTLIITPPTLRQQWQYELDRKFWLRFSLIEANSIEPDTAPGLIVSYSDLKKDRDLRLWLRMQQWGLLIVDEAHNLHRDPVLFEYVRDLSADADRALILSATPIQRRTSEYLSLLQLMEPARYNLIDEQMFTHMVSNHNDLRSTINYLTRGLRNFDNTEFHETIKSVIVMLDQDQVLKDLVSKVDGQSQDKGRDMAHNVLSYVSENYRIENRIIRNRRTSLDIVLPKRTVDSTFAYQPLEAERETIEVLHDMVDAYLRDTQESRSALEYSGLLFQAAFSSPKALLRILAHRGLALGRVGDNTLPAPLRFPYPKESALLEVLQAAPTFGEESDYLERLTWLATKWNTELSEALTNYPSYPDIHRNYSYRILQTMQAIHYALQGTNTKVIVFSGWWETLSDLIPLIARNYSTGSFAEFHAHLGDNKDLQNEADRFQSDDNCRVLICDELGGEGRNFQIADQIIHIDLPWSPSEVEQRIGRVDRLGRTSEVLSIVPYAQDSLEQSLFQVWQEAFNLFTQSISGLEVMLEGIQDDVVAALTRGSRSGLAAIVNEMTSRAESLRSEVEEERYYEESAINYRRRREFAQIVARYQDGELLRNAVLTWSHVIGLYSEYNRNNYQAIFFPSRFSLKSMENALFDRPPQMDEALHRSKRERDLKIKGTFNREVAIRREDIVFFAPGDEWTDSIMRNALVSDKGRCGSFALRMPGIETSWEGFELLYGISVDPRPLYRLGYGPSHLFRAHGFLQVATYRIVISATGEILKHSDPRYSMIATWFEKHVRPIHCGKREGENPALLDFKDRYPTSTWMPLVNDAVNAAEAYLRDEFSFMGEIAEEAEQEFDRSVRGQEAAYRWFAARGVGTSISEIDVRDLRVASGALLEGIRHPLFKLESAAFWSLEP